MTSNALYALLHDDTPIPDESDEIVDVKAHVALLKDLQCNVLTPHALRSADYLFLRAKGNDGDALRFVLGLMTRNPFERTFVRSALTQPAILEGASATLRGKFLDWAKSPQLTDAEHTDLRDVRVPSEYALRKDYLAYRQKAKAGTLEEADDEKDRGLIVNVLLTRKGYEILGAEVPDSAAFRDGMVTRRSELNDPDPDEGKWAKGYYSEIHALLVVGYNPVKDGKEATRLEALKKFLSSYVDIVQEEHGDVIKASDGTQSYRVEPFGFRDSISQPTFYQSDARDAKAAGAAHFDARAPLRLVLVSDPNGRTPLACGSYFVFRKLEQDVQSFYVQSRLIADKKGRPAADVRAEFLGRRQNGDPLVGGATARQGTKNDFDFSDDQAGIACPFHSHIRKTNPRSDVKPAYKPEDRRIARRGIPYGPALVREKNGTPVFDGCKVQLLAEKRLYDPSKDAPIGLLFLCAQAEISEQFEHIQSAWANNPKHPLGKTPGADTVIGELPTGQSNKIVVLTSTGFSQGLDTVYRPVVSLRGGDYFFAPSLGFLRGLLDDLLNFETA